MIQIPLLNSPSQTFVTTIDGVEYSLRIIYNTREETWSMDISGGGFSVSGVLLVGGIALLKQHSVPIDNMYMVNVSGLTEDATIDNLGSEVVLVVATDEEIEEAIALAQTI